VVVLTIGATPIAVRLFGESYAGSGPAIAVLAWGALFTATGGVTLYALVARGAERPLVAANVIAATLGLGLQLALIPRQGVVGAAIATVATAAIGQAAARPVADAARRRDGVAARGPRSCSRSA
jgi:O-antigen/teichoic acid export membrane protein